MNTVIDKRGVIVDISYTIDHEKRTISLCKEFTNKEVLFNFLGELDQKARRITTEMHRCKISYKIQEVKNNFILDAQFQFACPTEALIFEAKINHDVFLSPTSNGYYSR
ncbi:DUF406 family protein [Yersinia vastinensis]|uniref:DUF406 family protein n=1 Tax=Yersinia vastinensis TaxID=2890318 RepID=UPI00119D4A56|nr:DUF406 family protein [Yersinia vastinensis]